MLLFTYKCHAYRDKMSRVPRIQVEDTIYYVTPAGNYGELIFRNDEDYALYLELLSRYKKKYNFKLFAFCLTPNNINLLIEPSSDATISQIMHGLNPNYTKYFNGKYNRAGRLFRERYQIVLIEKAPNILKMTAYIHLRPKLLHLTNDISKYKYTSILSYLTEERGKPGAEALDGAQADKLNMVPEVAYVLDCLKDKNYWQFVDELGTDEIEELNKTLEKEKVIGSVDFRQKVESKVKGEREAPEATVQPIPIEKPHVLPQSIPIHTLKAAGHSVSNIWIFTAAACLVILSFTFSVFFAYTSIRRMKESIKQEIAEKDIESQNRLAKELDAASRNLNKTYEAKLSSYRAVIETLEAEKWKSEDELSKAKMSLRLRKRRVPAKDVFRTRSLSL